MKRDLPFIPLPPIAIPNPEKLITSIPSTHCFLIKTAIKDCPEWHAQRNNAVCASEVAQLLGLDEHTSRASVIKRKLGLEVVKPNAWRDNMFAWGHALEPMGIEIASNLLGAPVVQLGSLQHDRWPILQGEPDGVCSFNGKLFPVEVKTRCWPSMDDAFPYESEEDIPLKHWCQVQLYLELLNCDEGMLINVTLKHGFSYFWIRRDINFFHSFVVPLLEEFASGLLEMPTRAKDKIEVIEYVHDSLQDIIQGHHYF
jgi:hypothetical protein